ncbi:MAG: hypothetical protein ACFFEY_10950 [Candidatus Thorarchaeota archaeon]
MLIQIANWTSQESIDSTWFTLLMNTIEPYSDYKFWYKGFAEQFLYDGWLPYMGPFEDPSKYKNVLEYILNILLNDNHLEFIYPPFFFYSIIIPAFISVDFVFFPILISNLIIPFVIYKFLINFYGKNIASWGFIATALSPLLIFYNGGLLLNTSYITLFFLITLYFTAINRFTLATTFLSISLLFKQTIIFFILPYLVYVSLKKIEVNNKRLSFIKNFLKYSGIILGISLLGSLPWIIINPQIYIESLLVNQSITFDPSFFVPTYNSPMQWYSFLIRFGAPYWLLYIIAFPSFTLIGIILIQIIVLIMLYNWYRNNELELIKFIDIIIYIAFISHFFFPRGVYKYYFTFHIPLIVLWICFHFNEILSNHRSKRLNWMLILLVSSLIIIFIPRLYYLIVIWFIFGFIIRTNLTFRKREISSKLEEVSKN